MTNTCPRTPTTLAASPLLASLLGAVLPAQSLLADLVPAPAEGSAPQFAADSGPLFSATTPATGREPFLTDGTPAGTRLLADLAAGAASSDPSRFFRVGNDVWFNADDGVRGRELYRFDGTNLHTFDLIPGPQGAAPGEFVGLNGVVLFVGRSAASPVVPILWRTDGTLTGTRPLATMQQVFGGLVRLGDKVLFAATDPVAPFGGGLWVSDGTLAGTRRLVEMEPGAPSPAELLTRAGDKVFFRAFQEATGFELWCTDGTESGTRLVKDINPGRDPIRGQANSSTPAGLVAVRDSVYFFASERVAGRELWVSDGTEAGTRLVADTVPGPMGPFDAVLQIVASGSRLFFVQDDGVHGHELWTSDGTAFGTRMVQDLVVGRQGSIRRLAGVLAPVGSDGLVVFEAADAAGDREPWISDGTIAGTRRLADLNPAGSSNPGADGGFAVWERKVLFGADDGVRGREPWILDVADLGQPLAQTYGAGCGGDGPAGPRIESRSPPRAGGFLSVWVNDAPANRPAVLLWGQAKADPGFGACGILLESPDVFGVTVTLFNGQAAQNLSIPQVPALVGVEIDFQWILDQPGGPVLGVVALSDGLQVVLGG